MPLSLPKGSVCCQAEFAVLPFYLDRRTNLDRSGEQGHIMGPPVVLPLKNWTGWHLCLIWVHSCVLFCCASHSVFTPTDESEHYFHHHSSPTPSHRDPWKALKGHCGRDDRSLPWLLQASAFAVAQLPCLAEPWSQTGGGGGGGGGLP